MKRNIILTLALLLTLAAVVFAGTTSPPAKYHRLHGDIASIDSAATSFTVKHGKGETSTFKTDSATKYRGMGKDIGFADLKVGDDVRVSYTENGADKTAARVDVAHGKSPS